MPRIIIASLQKRSPRISFVSPRKSRPSGKSRTAGPTRCCIPAPANDTYKDASESAVEIVKALLVGLSLTADLQVKPQIDAKIKLTPPYQKSGLQKAFYAASIASLHELYDTLQLEDYLTPDKLWMKDWVVGTWRTLESSDGAGGRSPQAQRDDAPTPRDVFDRTNGLRNMVSNRLSVAAKLTVGFNELDGD